MRKKLPPPYSLKAFTLSEVLITLVIIGVIAAITVPMILQSTQEKELYSKFKKNYSLLQNSLERAQIDEGTLGDNTAIFTPLPDADRSYLSAQRFANYVNPIKVCRNKNQSGCSDVYYDVSYSDSNYKHGAKDSINTPKVVLADGSIWHIIQNDSCEWTAMGCATDRYGECIKDENGQIATPIPNPRYDCAEIGVDVNGAQGPNKYGKDVFQFYIRKDKVRLINWAPRGGNISKKILTNEI